MAPLKADNARRVRFWPACEVRFSEIMSQVSFGFAAGCEAAAPPRRKDSNLMLGCALVFTGGEHGLKRTAGARLSNISHTPFVA